MWPVVVAVVIITVLLYYLWTSSFSKWRKSNVPHLPPHFMWGNFREVIYQKEAFFQTYQRIYRTFPDVPYVGVYIVNRPGLLLRDPELVKEVLVNNFLSFQHNDRLIDENIDLIFGSNPVNHRGDQWKTRRAAHSLQFSSGKIKHMYTLMSQGGDRMIRFLDDELKKGGKCVTMEALDLASKYTIYNVANCTMGIDPKTFEDDKAEMREMGRLIVNPDQWHAMKNIFLFILPWLSKYLSVSLIPSDVTNMFRRLVRDTLQYRKENSIVLNDFFDAIQEYKGQQNSIDEMVVQIGGLFLDGYATNSAAINFILYELAVNTDIQEKLREEVDEVLAKYNGDIPFDAFQEMSYLNAVVSEGLRMHPPLGFLTKLCTRSYTFPPTKKSGKPLTIEPNTPVVIPLYGIHFDEKYFPDPERFDPTRFLGENKENVEKSTYLAFNDGPRTCIGKRFALVQTQLICLKLVSEFEFTLSSKTIVPLSYDVRSFLVAVKGGVWIDIYKRKK